MSEGCLRLHARRLSPSWLHGHAGGLFLWRPSGNQLGSLRLPGCETLNEREPVEFFMVLFGPARSPGCCCDDLLSAPRGLPDAHFMLLESNTERRQKLCLQLQELTNRLLTHIHSAHSLKPFSSLSVIRYISCCCFLSEIIKIPQICGEKTQLNNASISPSRDATPAAASACEEGSSESVAAANIYIY